MVGNQKPAEFEVGCRGFLGKPALPLQTVGRRGQTLKQAVENMADTAASERLWVRRKVNGRGKGG